MLAGMQFFVRLKSHIEYEKHNKNRRLEQPLFLVHNQNRVFAIVSEYRLMHIHFIGIGGIGVSALAKYYLSAGATVSGSDLCSSEIITELERLHAKITIGVHKTSRLPKRTDKVIYTAAIPASNPELREARKSKIVVQSYAQAVGELTQKYRTITVSGSHGKSTTTALLGIVLTEGYLDPTVIVGTKVKEFGNTNFRKGYGSHLVLEADEWNKSFLEYSPSLAIVTNIDAEHLDTYGSVEGVENAFREYLRKVPRGGFIVANADDARLAKIAKKFRAKVIWYSARSDPEAKLIRKIIKIPGEHNVANALAVLKAARKLGVHEPLILQAISHFRGTWRRFEFAGMSDGAFIFSDYGHHPKEIMATLQGARSQFPFRRIWCVYQPHQYQRLSYLWNDFVEAFDGADRICLLPVYSVAGREKKGDKAKANSKKLSEALQARGKNVSYAASFDEAEHLIRSHTRKGDVVFFMGAGDIDGLANRMV